MLAVADGLEAQIRLGLRPRFHLFLARSQTPGKLLQLAFPGGLHFGPSRLGDGRKLGSGSRADLPLLSLRGSGGFASNLGPARSLRRANGGPGRAGHPPPLFAPAWAFRDADGIRRAFAADKGVQLALQFLDLFFDGHYFA